MPPITLVDMSTEEPIPVRGPAYWRSLDELASTGEFQDWLHREFPQGASELNGVNRRQFMKVMAASFSLAGLGMAGCRQPRQHVLPYAKQPENIIPGVPNYYSTSMPLPWGNLPLIAESHQGRPTKLEGNPSYAPAGGATDAHAQASVLDLYDPDRLAQSRSGKRRLGVADVYDLLDRTSGRLRSGKGKGIAVLAEKSASPSRRRLVAELRALAPELIWAEYEPVALEGLADACRKLKIKPLRVAPAFDKAKRILALDSDFLFSEPNAVVHARAFAEGRKVKGADSAKGMNRLYAVESQLSLTGAMADHRLRMSSTEIGGFVAALAARILPRAMPDLAWIDALGAASKGLDAQRPWIEECADDLLEHKGTSLVVCGAHLPAVVHLMVAHINQALGAQGKTLHYLELPDDPEVASIGEVTGAIRKGSVQTLILLGGNPAYDAPADLDWFMAQKLVPEVIRLSTHEDESAEGARWLIARSHYLEAWDDGLTYDGCYVPVQPLIEPLFETVSDLEFIARLSGRVVSDPYKIVRETAEVMDASLRDDHGFARFLAEGVSLSSSLKKAEWTTAPEQDEFIREGLAKVARRPSLGLETLEVRIVPSSHTYDGRYANNGWMMECPDPLTKLTWDNAILISPGLAKELEAKGDAAFFPRPGLLNRLNQTQRAKGLFSAGKEQAWVAELRIGDTSVTGPVHVQPGLATYTVVLSMGFGRRVCGRVGTGVGFDVFPLVNSNEQHVRHGATLKLTGDTYPLANTQEHWAIEGREILREANASEYAENPDYVLGIGMEAHSPAVYGKDKDKSLAYKATATPKGGSMYEHPDFTAPQQWGMTVDLNSCIGCNACVVACQSENNIPIVGKDQVLRGREMHWIRLDRYFSSASNDRSDIPEEVQVSFQGMACTHCEMAPCETVCPVNATVHDEQGLNVMAYNRCVGTRYCANNCPYKVRRFNFFDWHKREIGKFYLGPFGPVDEPELPRMQRNPDVTVRMRGVMEKCTYCVQRIEAAKIRQKSLARDSDAIEVLDGTIQTACQQVCPTRAITFGDITQPDSAVSLLKASDRNYSVLGYLNIRPRTTYLSKLRNPNPKMPDAFAMPYTREDYESRYGHHPGEHETHGTEHAESDANTTVHH